MAIESSLESPKVVTLELQVRVREIRLLKAEAESKKLEVKLDSIVKLVGVDDVGLSDFKVIVGVAAAEGTL